MNKIKNKLLIGLIIGGSFLTSCSDDFLKPDPLSFYEPEVTFTTESGLQSVLSHLDRHIRTYWTYFEGKDHTFPIATQYIYSDIGVASKTDQRDIFADVALRLTPTNDLLNGDVNYLKYFWDETYAGIKSANTVTSYIDRIEGLSEKTKNEYLGRAYFHRAYRYLSLVFMWKDVPFVTKIIEGPKFNYRSTSRKAILDKMVEDMEFAIEWVPEQKDMAYIGMINKGACRVLLTKLYLSTGQWDKAITQANILIDESGYSLMMNTFGSFIEPLNNEAWPITRNVIWDLHRAENKLLSANKEVILGMPNRGVAENSFIPFPTMRSLVPYWNDGKLQTPDGKLAVEAIARNNSRYNPLYDYNRSIGRGIGFIRPTYYAEHGMWDINGVRDDGDLRRSTAAGNWVDMEKLKVTNKDSKHLGEYLQKSWTTDTIRDWFGWPHYKIYLLDHNAEANISNTSVVGARSSANADGNADWYCYRLAEVYLLRAEAKFYKGDVAGAAADVNEIRKRAKCEQLYTTVTIGDIVDERARELYMEEWRYMELNRISYCLALSGKPDEFGYTYDVNTYDKQSGRDPNGGSYWYQRIVHYNNYYNKNDNLKVNGHSYVIDKYNLYLPIPQSAIDANRLDKLRQNYGYTGYDETIPVWETWQEAVADEDNLQ